MYEAEKDALGIKTPKDKVVDSQAVGYAKGEISRRLEIVEHELRSMRGALRNKDIPNTIDFGGLLIREVKKILELVASA